jgi:hypothetical protein
MLFRTVWWLILCWLAVCLIGQLYFAWLWTSNAAGPLRRETLIGLTLATFYAWPAVLAVLLLRWKYWEESPPIERKASILVIVTGALVFFALSLVPRL